MDQGKSQDIAENDTSTDLLGAFELHNDAKVHVEHAEARIHALRERMKRKHTKDRQLHMLHDKQNKVADTSEEEKKLMMQIRQMEEMVRRRDEVNNRYAIQLSDMVRKDGEVESLKVENIALQKKLELIASSLALHSEEQAGYEREKEQSTYRQEEVDRLRDEKRRMFRELWDKDDKLKSVKDTADARSHELISKKEEWEKLRASTKELSETLNVMGGKKDDALARLNSEKEAIKEELARKKNEKAKVTKEKEVLKSDVSQKEHMEEKINNQLRARDRELAALEQDKSGLNAQFAELESLRKRLAKMDAKIKVADEDLIRRTRKYEALAIEKADLRKEVEAQRLNTARGQAAYRELEKKIAEFQASTAGSHDKEVTLLRKIESAQHEIGAMKPKYGNEMQRHRELDRENAILKQKLSELADSSLAEQRKLREDLDDRTAKQADKRKQNFKVKQLLTDAIAKNGGYKDKIESYKALQMKQNEDEDMEVITEEESEAQSMLQGRMTHLLRRGTEMDRVLAQASSIEAQMANQLAVIEQQRANAQMAIVQREQAIVQLQNMLVEKQRAMAKKNWDKNYQHQARIKALKAEIEGWQTKARSVQQTTARWPSQIEAKHKRLQSLEKQIRVRDQQIATLSQAIHNTKLASAKKPVVALNGMYYDYKVTSVLDHRPKTDEVRYYKHKKPLGDYHHHIHTVDKMPDYSLETELERKRRREAKLRRMHERRPSLS